MQKETIDTQTAAIEKLVSHFDLGSQKPKSKFMKYVLPAAACSTLLLMLGIFLMMGFVMIRFINN